MENMEKRCFPYLIIIVILFGLPIYYLQKYLLTYNKQQSHTTYFHFKNNFLLRHTWFSIITYMYQIIIGRGKGQKCMIN